MATIAAALAGCMAMMLGSVSAGHAAPPGPGNIDPNQRGSIVVHKHRQPEADGAPADGSRQSVPNPMKGVKFSIAKINLDLTKPEDWAKLKDLTVGPDGQVPGQTVQAHGTEQETDGAGETTFNVEIGAYVVTEGDDNGNNNIVKKAAPFIVVVPMAINNTWTYDVHVYPKNSVAQVTKSVNDAAALGAGSAFAWPVEATLPQLANADELQEVKISDTLDNRLDPMGGNPAEVVTGVSYADVPLNPTDYQADVRGQEVTVTLLAGGLGQVKANSGKVLKVTINTKVKAGDIANGIIENRAKLSTRVNNQANELNTDGSSKTYWGVIDIDKKDASNQLGLQGAEFQVFASEQDAQGGNDPINVNGVSTFTTDGAGKLKIGPLNASQVQSKNYWIKEVKAPVGYVLPEGNSGIKQVTVIPGQNAQAETTVENTKATYPQLPLTGGSGTALFILGGLTLVGVSVFLAQRARKQAVQAH